MHLQRQDVALYLSLTSEERLASDAKTAADSKLQKQRIKDLQDALKVCSTPLTFTLPSPVPLGNDQDCYTGICLLSRHDDGIPACSIRNRQ